MSDPASADEGLRVLDDADVGDHRNASIETAWMAIADVLPSAMAKPR
jgi:hypothetical protein